VARVASYGSWRSPVTSELIVQGAARLAGVALERGITYVVESRPEERGRSVLLELRNDAPPRDLVHAPFDVRTRVHEYGGAAFAICDGVAFFSHFADGRLYRTPIDESSAPEPITPPGALRFAALRHDARRRRLVAVAEDHSSGAAEPTNAIVSVRLDGSGIAPLAKGADFYSSPELRADGRALAWLEWKHPNMPWDGTELWVAELDDEGGLRDARRVAGGPAESIFQPEWGADGKLFFASDRTGYWNLYALDGGRTEPLCPMEAEFGAAAWQFDMRTYAVVGERLLAIATQEGRATLGWVELGSFSPIDLPFTEIWNVHAEANRAVFAAASPSTEPSLVEMDLRTTKTRTLRRFGATNLDAAYVSVPTSIVFSTSNGQTARALHYAPKNPEFRSDGVAPPLLVKSHGGPTAAASTTLNLRTQYYTSRGIAVLDVDYRGSSGYGRAYREALYGNWGVADVDDCVNGALHLVRQGAADPERLMITGGSAGGYTTLAALTFRDVFKAGASHYGISDLEALARDTHKFESRYLDRLIGPYPARRDLYVARSPIHHAERLACPVIFFQGLEDRVVPPNQAEAMLRVLRQKGIPLAYVPFPGEQHGFRRAENIRVAIDAELLFFAKVLKFEVAEGTLSESLLRIENLGSFRNDLADK
jgi:dipeptidyl aminopeptidase/acylaminoacyl peptidase